MKHRIILPFYLMRYNLTWTFTYALAIIYFLNFCPNNIGITVPVIPVLYTTKYSIAILHPSAGFEAGIAVLCINLINHRAPFTFHSQEHPEL